MGTLGHRDSQRPPETQRQKQRYSVMRHGDTEKKKQIDAREKRKEGQSGDSAERFKGKKRP